MWSNQPTILIVSVTEIILCKYLVDHSSQLCVKSVKNWKSYHYILHPLVLHCYIVAYRQCNFWTLRQHQDNSYISLINCVLEYYYIPLKGIPLQDIPNWMCPQNDVVAEESKDGEGVVVVVGGGGEEENTTKERRLISLIFIPSWTAPVCVPLLKGFA